MVIIGKYFLLGPVTNEDRKWVCYFTFCSFSYSIHIKRDRAATSARLLDQISIRFIGMLKDTCYLLIYF